MTSVCDIHVWGTGGAEEEMVGACYRVEVVEVAVMEGSLVA